MEQKKLLAEVGRICGSVGYVHRVEASSRSQINFEAEETMIKPFLVPGLHNITPFNRENHSYVFPDLFQIIQTLNLYYYSNTPSTPKNFNAFGQISKNTSGNFSHHEEFRQNLTHT